MTSTKYMVYMTNQHVWEYEKVWLMYRFRVPRAILGLSWAQNNSFWLKMKDKSLKDPQYSPKTDDLHRIYGIYY